MAADLTLTAGAADGGVRVVLAAGAQATGLADMLHQFLEQTLEHSPRKVQQARRLRGRAMFRAAEDEEVCVCVAFEGDRIELRGGAAVTAGVPSITADFLTLAHLTSGQESPFRLLAQQKLKVRFSVPQVPFLLGMLRFMKIESTAPRPAWRHRALWMTAAAVAAGIAYWYTTTMR